MGSRLDTTLAILNGFVGDHLARTNNGLATPMALVDNGAAISARAAIGVRATPATSKAVVLVHGLMSRESVWRFPSPAPGLAPASAGPPRLAPGSGDYGSRLARDARFTPFYLRYNTGLPIADNGVALAELLDAIVDAYGSACLPLDEIVLLGHSMGGLVVRSACHHGAAGKHRFLPLVRRSVYVGTPHLGAPYERAGRIVSALLRKVPDPLTELIADIADLRSAGLQDLGDADLRHEDRVRRSSRLRLSDWQHPVPLLPEIDHYLIAGSLSRDATLASLFGDWVVPVKSALAGAATPPSRSDGLIASHVAVFPGLAHVGLAHDEAVYAQILTWLTEAA